MAFWLAVDDRDVAVTRNQCECEREAGWPSANEQDVSVRTQRLH